MVRRRTLIPRVVPHEVPLDRPTLEEVETGSSNKPQCDVDDVGPPSYPEPLLAYEEKPTVEAKKSELDPGKCGSGEDHSDPDVLESVGKVSGIVGILLIDAPGMESESIARRGEEIGNHHVDEEG